MLVTGASPFTYLEVILPRLTGLDLTTGQLGQAGWSPTGLGCLIGPPVTAVQVVLQARRWLQDSQDMLPVMLQK
jgi:hypothetical protein